MSFIFSCKGCTKRVPGCHDQCETYKQEKEEYNRRKALNDCSLEYGYLCASVEKTMTKYLRNKIKYKRYKR